MDLNEQESPTSNRVKARMRQPFPWAKFFFRVKLENIKFLHVNNMWVFTLFIEKDMSEKL